MKRLILTIIILLFFSCDDSQYIRKYSIPKIPSIKNEFNIQSSQHSDLPFSWNPPDSWKIKEEEIENIERDYLESKLRICFTSLNLNDFLRNK